jgi:hypothetical protein
MATKDYYLVFGAGNPADNTGLTPSFTTFANNLGVATTAPGVTEIIAASGLYRFQYEAQGSVIFVVDGDVGGLSAIPDADRYITGSLDVEDRSEDFISGLGASLQAQIEGFSTALGALIGATSDVIGDTSTDPSTMFGFFKRAQEMAEGDQQYTKATGVLAYTDRTGATTMASKTIVDGTSTVTRS